MKEIISKVTGLRGQLQNIANREVLNQLIDVQIRLENQTVVKDYLTTENKLISPIEEEMQQALKIRNRKI